MRKLKSAILGPGNIGMDLMYKIMSRGKNIELKLVSGIVAGSRGLALARENGFETSLDGVESILADPEIRLVFECTSAKAHLANAPRYREADKIAIDLTPAAVGPYVVPAVNLEQHVGGGNFNMVTCGGQATVPLVAAVNAVTPVEYAEIVATLASKSAGPGTRANIDEFTETTADAVVSVGGAKTGKAIIILNPAEPPLLMRNTVYCKVQNPDGHIARINAQVSLMVEKVRQYVPGYRLRLGPELDGDRVIMMVEVEGEGSYLPKYSGNLDIITATALATAEEVAARILHSCPKNRGER
ncbi:MAG: acetaldehyde dehydrogenase (acetylating) [Desulfovibrio sp.]|jgi:acetaldehyde dehydrogenase|nr:acetaldehyde dehydrogenase (acetylating) [Desulfovibrio sp.]